MAMIPGFNVFNNVLRAKLLIFYADSLIPQLMACRGDDIIVTHHGRSNEKIAINGRFNEFITEFTLSNFLFIHLKIV
jgi:hypothetical protein